MTDGFNWLRTVYNVGAQNVAVSQLPVFFFFWSCCYFVVSICINCRGLSLNHAKPSSTTLNTLSTQSLPVTRPNINYTSSRHDQPADRYSAVCTDLCLLLSLRNQDLAVSQKHWTLVMFAQGIKADTPFNVCSSKYAI